MATMFVQWRILLFLAVALPPHLKGQQTAPGCSPLGTDRDWHSGRSTQIDSNTYTWEPTWAKVPPGFRPDALAGQFQLTVVATVAGSSDTLVSGRLSLWPTPDSLESVQPALIIGAADLDFQRLGQLNMAYSPRSTDGEQPGVQLSYDGQRASLILGAASTVRHRWRDAGVVFYIQEVARTGFRGRWREATPSTRPAQGYFCASRLPEQ